MTFKRYFGKLRLPCVRHLGTLRGVGRVVRYIVLPAVVAVGVMLCLRTWVITQYALTAPDAPAGLRQGDRLLVVRTAYAFGRHPMRGDLVLFRSPEGDGRRLVGVVTAVPGDTVATPREGRLVENMFRVGDVLVFRTLIVGRVACVTYSVAPDAPFYRCLRPGRFFRKVGTAH